MMPSALFLVCSKISPSFEPLTRINSHGTTRTTQTMLVNIPCLSLCFRGRFQVCADDTPKHVPSPLIPDTV